MEAVKSNFRISFIHSSYLKHNSEIYTKMEIISFNFHLISRNFIFENSYDLHLVVLRFNKNIIIAKHCDVQQ